MAIYHLSVKTIGRSAGRSATAAAAYRSGERVEDLRTGLVHDYTRRSGVEHTELFTPDGSPDWAQDRSALWNAAESAERRKNSTVAREFEVALPSELSGDQRRDLVADFARELADRHGMAVDVAIHGPGKDGDHRNHHAHILCSTRRLTPEGFTDKTRELDNQRSGEITHWRERWGELSNQHLERGGRTERIDHRSLADQRAAALEQGDVIQADALDRRPTIHTGPAVTRLMAQGKPTDRGDHQRKVQALKATVIDLAEARRQLAAVQRQPSEHEMAPREVTKAAVDRVTEQREQAEATLTPAANADRGQIKDAWRAEFGRHEQDVTRQAHRAQRTAQGQLVRQEKRIEVHDTQRPEAPSGLFARFKQSSYEAAHEAWQKVRGGLQKRLVQLQNRVQRLGRYTEPQHEGIPHPGQQLAYQRAEAAQPQLAQAFIQVISDERREQIEAVQERKQAQQAERRAERAARKAERAERIQGRSNQERPTPGRENTPQSAKERKLAEFREKMRRDRENGRGGRGR